MSADILRELAHAKAVFQLRTLALIIGAPAPAGTRPQGQDAAGGLVRSTSDAVTRAARQAPTLKSTPTRTAK